MPVYGIVGGDRVSYETFCTYMENVLRAHGPATSFVSFREQSGDSAIEWYARWHQRFPTFHVSTDIFANAVNICKPESELILRYSEILVIVGESEWLQKAEALGKTTVRLPASTLLSL